MKNLIGKKVRGFKFDSRDHCVWFVTLEEYIGRVGVIDQYLDMVNVFIVKYGEDCLLYPAELIEQHIVDEEDTLTPQGKAQELVNKYWGKGITNDKEIAKQCALMAIRFAEKIMAEYGRETHELQNMDRFFHDLEQVKTEIEKL